MMLSTVLLVAPYARPADAPAVEPSAVPAVDRVGNQAFSRSFSRADSCAVDCGVSCIILPCAHGRAVNHSVHYTSTTRYAVDFTVDCVARRPASRTIYYAAGHTVSRAVRHAISRAVESATSHTFRPATSCAAGYSISRAVDRVVRRANGHAISYKAVASAGWMCQTCVAAPTAMLGRVTGNAASHAATCAVGRNLLFSSLVTSPSGAVSCTIGCSIGWATPSATRRRGQLASCTARPHTDLSSVRGYHQA